jgi:hypothetical protein
MCTCHVSYSAVANLYSIHSINFADSLFLGLVRFWYVCFPVKLYVCGPCIEVDVGCCILKSGTIASGQLLLVQSSMNVTSLEKRVHDYHTYWSTEIFLVHVSPLGVSEFMI